MNKASLYLGKIAGIRLYLHWTFLLLIVYVVINSYRNGFGQSSTVYSVVLVITAFVCVTLHEFGHALTAGYFKFKTRDITLLPIGGIARMDELPQAPKQELAVAIAGPLVNVVIALILLPFVLNSTQPEMMDVTMIGGTWDNFLYSIFYVNLSLAVFNLIPAFPMDGGRVFRALLSFFVSRVKATLIAARTGQAISILFVVFGLFYNPVLAIIGVVIFLLARAENQSVKTASLLDGYTVNDVLMTKFHSLDESATVNDAVKALLDVQAFDFLVTKDNAVTGTLSSKLITKAVAEKGLETPVSEVMNKEVQRLTPDMPLEKLFRGIRTDRNNIMPVFSENRLIGIVDLNNMLELIMITQANEKHRWSRLSQPATKG